MIMKVTKHPLHALLPDFGQITQAYFNFADKPLRKTEGILYALAIKSQKRYSIKPKTLI